ncbi:hypothetical protein EW145_g5466 [Phellinidium pouzarii]|uniref:Pop1 N-terminal domain-containing protein n=1 Tax=Phellinidium pouzarii TaxID=167371 RepID=A0A4S4L0F9_9AGAM|nr:hypothetical protein EW145_g5466 [Phellinidium pouzarii]
MSSKRKRDEDGEGQRSSNNATGVQNKKQRMDAARTISVQFVVPNSSNPPLGMQGLPSTLDVENFTEARAFEIKAMQEAMDSASAGATHRVFQTLPRHLRRRAASHDVRRVPARLRQKARAEVCSELFIEISKLAETGGEIVKMDAPGKPISKKKQPKRGMVKSLKRTEEFLLRQVDKSWLETHIWHAKRMKMENMWGYRLAVTPTEKSFRPSHRASVHGCILHDASYDAIIELKGPETYLKEVIVDCCDPQTPKSYPFDIIGPIEILWKPISETSPVPAQAKSSKTKGRERKVSPTHRTLIKYSVQACLQIAQSSSKKEAEIEVADLRNKFNIFELMGPKSSQVIHGALSPTKDDNRDELKEFWSALGQLQTAGSAPRGIVAGFSVLDPRLQFPPTNTKIVLKDKLKPDSSLHIGLWPTSKLANSTIWDEEIRVGLSKPRFKKKDLDSRKSKHLVPGSKLKPLRQDDRVPVLLIQRSVEAQNGPSTSTAARTRPLHGWTVIVPKGWGMPFFSSLTHTGTRVGGQREKETQHFEAGCLYFPHDYPCSRAYAEFVANRARQERETWEKKPPAKRASWEKLETRSPWKPDWEVVLGLKTVEPENGDLVMTQRDVQDNMEVDKIEPWLLRGQEMSAFVQEISHSMQPATDLLARINDWRCKRSISPVACSATVLLQSALVNIRLSIPRSGSPEDDAIIYKMSDEEARKWYALLERDKCEPSEKELSKLRSSSDSTVGYITSGNYSLSIGRGSAIGAMSLFSYLEMKEQLHRLRKSTSLPLVKLRNKDSIISRAAYAELAC